MPYRVRITPRALAEIDSTLARLTERAPITAQRWYERLRAAIASLADYPQRCSLAPEDEWFAGELRQLLHGKRRGVYRILFEVRGDEVIVLRVRHGAQDLLGPGEL